MSLKRRQLLLLTGSCFGLGLAAFSQKIAQKSPISSPPSSIASPVAPSPLAVKIVVISDLNSQYGSTTYEPEVDKAIALIPHWQPDLVLCGGDMVAGQKRTLTQSQIKAMWTAFDRHIAAPLRSAKIPFGFTIGNHDGSGVRSQGQYLFESERNLAAAYWNDPSHDTRLNFVDRTGFPFYYTFTQKGIFYLVWDASTAMISTEQLAWVEKSLALPVAQVAKMRIVIGHLPLYGIAVGRDKAGEFLVNAEKLRLLLERDRVHTYISGHDHAYYPGKRGHLELLHAGALGSGPRKLLNSEILPRKTLTIVDVNLNSEETKYTTYDMNTLSVINIETLPRFIMAPNGKVLRQDVQES